MRPPALRVLLPLIAALAPACSACFGQSWEVRKAPDGGSLDIMLDGRPFATYSFRDPAISRPYFANITSPGGQRITRNHPPAPDDPQDHAKLHPGLWMAFGDLSGSDNWRLAAPVEHVKFIEEPTVNDGQLRFAVENRYLAAADGPEICREKCRYVFEPAADGVLMRWDSTFRSDAAGFYFGDQEEMGLGVRMAKNIAVKSNQGGRLLNSSGQRNEKEVWGRQAEWCDYSGPLGDEFVGVMIVPHPANFRKSWCHARDAGLLTLNPFGQRAFTRSGEPSRIEIARGEDFRLRYGILFHWHGQQADFDAAQSAQRILPALGE